jgi:prepilin-type N-terminal cleavage/methylation domain-containing protein
MNIRNQRGGTLVEVIVAMLIMALVMIGLNSTLLCLIKSNSASSQLSSATSTGYSLFEELRVKDYSDIKKSGKDTVNNKFIREWEATDSISYKKIDISVYWPVTSKSHVIHFSTIIAKKW